MWTLGGIFLISIASLLGWGQTADIVFAGDAMMHQAQIDAARRADGTYDYSQCFAALQPYVEGSDYAVVNLETPLGGAPYSGYPCFCAPDSYAAALVDAGFDLLLTANNHTLDRRDRGLRRTLDVLDSLRCDHIGTFRNASERSRSIPLVRDIKGFEVAFLNYTYGTNGIRLTTDAVVDYIDAPRIEADIKAARAAGAEIVTVCIHWGDEYRLLPNSVQKSLASRMVDAGADLVIGAHPHVIQPMQMVERADGSRALVVYSLGNFLSNMRTRDTRGGAMVKVRLRRDDEGRATVDTATYRLVFTLPPSRTRRGYVAVPAEKADDPAWSQARDAFVGSARGVFDRHNRGVGCDTSVIHTTPRSAARSIMRLLGRRGAK